MPLASAFILTFRYVQRMRRQPASLMDRREIGQLRNCMSDKGVRGSFRSHDCDRQHNPQQWSHRKSRIYLDAICRSLR
jgi:hypothetical protein